MATKIKTIWHHLGTHGYGQLIDHLAPFENCKYNTSKGTDWESQGQHFSTTWNNREATWKQLRDNCGTTLIHQRENFGDIFETLDNFETSLTQI